MKKLVETETLLYTKKEHSVRLERGKQQRNRKKMEVFKKNGSDCPSSLF